MVSPMRQRGFTLVEIIVGIVIMAIALVYLSSVLFPQGRNSVSPVMEVKAAELAQTLMNEILAKSYDENSDHDGSRWRCGEVIDGLIIPACSNTLGPDVGEDQRLLYDDVDDFDTDGAFIAADEVLNLNAGPNLNQYPNFNVRIGVTLDAAGFLNTEAKRIDIEVQLPASQGTSLTFSAYRGNY